MEQSHLIRHGIPTQLDRNGPRGTTSDEPITSLCRPRPLHCVHCAKWQHQKRALIVPNDSIKNAL